MDCLIQQLRQALASALYAKSAQESYVPTAKRLGAQFGVGVGDVSREQVRDFVGEIVSGDGRPSTKTLHLCALRFLFKKTIGKPEMVSFISLPKKHSPLPTVLSLEEVGALIRHDSQRTIPGRVRPAFSLNARFDRSLAALRRSADFMCSQLFTW